MGVGTYRGSSASVSNSYRIFDGKVVIHSRNKMNISTSELLASGLFQEILEQYIRSLEEKQSRLLRIFDHAPVEPRDVLLLAKTLQFLENLPADLVPRVLEGSEQFFRDKSLLNDFVEQFYNYWRRLHRLMVCDSLEDRLDQRPYRTFNDTVEALMYVVREAYRNVQENITGRHPRVYRQVSAGVEIGTIAMQKKVPFKAPLYEKLNQTPMLRQVLIYPPMIFNTPSNKRSGMFERVYTNPLEQVEMDPQDWLCYPAKVGQQLILVYFNLSLFELGFSLSNLFELADDADLDRQPDAVFVFGHEPFEENPSGSETIFYDDEENGILVGTVPYRDRYGYFGYLKKMVLTLHNIKAMKQGWLPFHGAMVNIAFRNDGDINVLIVGDTGAGKSETLEALRTMGNSHVEDLTIIADDMGSMQIGADGRVYGYGTEMGAFVRLDDLQSGYALGQIDRVIMMNPDQTNARVVLPVTKYQEVVQGYPVDIILYANNYDLVDEDHPVIQAFHSPEEALAVYRRGAVMSKGTTNTTGMVELYFGNIFGPPQYHDLHEGLAQNYFQALFDSHTFVGETRTCLGVHGLEHDGPAAAAKALMETIEGMLLPQH